MKSAFALIYLPVITREENVGEYKNRLEVVFDTSEGRIQVYKFILAQDLIIKSPHIDPRGFEIYWGKKCESYGSFSVKVEQSFLDARYFCMEVGTPEGDVQVHFVFVETGEKNEGYYVNAVAKILS